jgi:hypothetical protein
MKLSVEGKVAAAVGAAFVALTVGAIAQKQGNNEGQAGRSNGYGSENNPRINTEMSQQDYKNSLPGRTEG